MLGGSRHPSPLPETRRPLLGPTSPEPATAPSAAVAPVGGEGGARGKRVSRLVAALKLGVVLLVPCCVGRLLTGDLWGTLNAAAAPVIGLFLLRHEGRGFRWVYDAIARVGFITHLVNQCCGVDAHGSFEYMLFLFTVVVSFCALGDAYTLMFGDPTVKHSDDYHTVLACAVCEAANAIVSLQLCKELHLLRAEQQRRPSWQARAPVPAMMKPSAAWLREKEQGPLPAYRASPYRTEQRRPHTLDLSGRGLRRPRLPDSARAPSEDRRVRRSASSEDAPGADAPESTRWLRRWAHASSQPGPRALSAPTSPQPRRSRRAATQDAIAGFLRRSGQRAGDARYGDSPPEHGDGRPAVDDGGAGDLESAEAGRVSRADSDDVDAPPSRRERDVQSKRRKLFGALFHEG